MDINPHYKGGVQTPDLSVPDGQPSADANPPQAQAASGERLFRHRVSYLYNEQPRQQELEYDQAQLPPEVAALRLLLIHYGDGENSMLMPAADASPQEVMDQAQLMGITTIEIQSTGREIHDVSE
ncbi:hypothetical protein [Pseudomonas sp. RIT-PI-S]|uniref:hypothetical protein n=1 Tax=Pseudomonas sp. RIT-PI-S TaxID=3035295 RepID=UPI0021D8C530|nr:hypothetical protein [Pseudomonas sp. RIT-PI-S]